MTWMDKDYSITEIPSIAAELTNIISKFRVVTFSGNLGAGKTTLIKELCKRWGVEETVSSPTFSLVNQYSISAGTILENIYHIDLYRLKDEAEAYQAGIEDDLYSGHLCLVEWPEKAPGIIPDTSLSIQITHLTDDQRHIRVVSGEN